MNVFFARDPLRWRPACSPSHAPFALKEIEDLLVLGAPNQVTRPQIPEDLLVRRARAWLR